jgi:REP-associated tyrosine transposase
MIKKDWPHAPIHRLGSDGVYMITGATLYKHRLFSNPEKLTLLENEILTLAKLHSWQLEAWAVFMNHYHLIARGEPNATQLGRYLKHVHCNTARNLNLLDKTAGRDVWYNFWETRLTYERSYLARLNYVHQNAVKHRLVTVASQYPWCSAAWFERTASPAAIKTVYSFKTEKINVYDDY